MLALPPLTTDLPPPMEGKFREALQSAVQSVDWTYSLFWKLCPQQGVLVWGDGYYNGPIKTRKTVQPMGVSAEETSLRRSQQLRELYESLSVRERSRQTRRPSAALLPEDLSESEWFYLTCISFSFPPGIGLPGKAHATRQTVWLAGANEVDNSIFPRAILAKSAGIQTVVCIPAANGVLELGTIEKVKEDIGLVQHVRGFLYSNPNQKPTIFVPSSMQTITTSEKNADDEEVEEDGDGYMEEEEESESEFVLGAIPFDVGDGGLVQSMEPSKLMQQIIPGNFSIDAYLEPSLNSSFSNWCYKESNRSKKKVSSQATLKSMLFNAPLLLTKKKIEKGTSHVMAERQRREKLNKRFIILSSLIPTLTKMDKPSILKDTIEYVKQLRERIRELESENKEVASSELDLDTVQVSIIETDALLEIKCRYREVVLLRIMQAIHDLRLEVTLMQSSIHMDVLYVHIRAKVRENSQGRKTTIIEVKRIVDQIILES